MSTVPYQKMEPLNFVGESDNVIISIKKLLQEIPGATLHEEVDLFLHFVFESRFFKFKDDVQFLIDSKNKLIHFRSGSRIGFSDLGANRRRMLKISTLLSSLNI